MARRGRRPRRFPETPPATTTPRDTKPAVSDDDVKALTADGRAFATKIFAALRKERKDQENFFFSPHGIQIRDVPTGAVLFLGRVVAPAE